MSGTAGLGKQASQARIMTMSLSQYTKFAYTWFEDGNDVTVTIPLTSEGDIKKGDIAVEITATTIRAGLKGQPPILQLLALEAGDGKIDPQSLFFLAMVMDMGTGAPIVPNDPKQALAGLRAAAERGCVHAMLRLGEIHTPGEGAFAGGRIVASAEAVDLEEDCQVAFDHYAKAARKGDAWGATKLGMAITDPASLGGSTEWNAAPDDGAVWLTVGAKAGVPLACYLLGVYEEGLGATNGQEAYQRAVEWYRAAGDLPVALHKMGCLRARGAPGVPRDAAAARALFARGCALDPSMHLPSDAEIEELGAARRGAAPGAAILALGAAAAAAALVLFAIARTRR